MADWSAWQKYPSGDLARLAELANIQGRIVVYGRDEIGADGARQFQLCALARGLGPEPQVLILERDKFPAFIPSNDLARAHFIEARFQEHRRDGELEILRDAWIQQAGTPTEKMELAARVARLREEARQRAAKLIEERKNGNGKR